MKHLICQADSYFASLSRIVINRKGAKFYAKAAKKFILCGLCVSFLCAFAFKKKSLPQYLLHRSSLPQLIYQLIQVAEFLHQRVFNIFYSVATDHTRYF